jgi:hypothetical protein
MDGPRSGRRQKNPLLLLLARQALKPKGRPLQPRTKETMVVPPPLGTVPKLTAEVRDLARALVTDPDYVVALKGRLLKGRAAHLEPTLWHYAWGKPKERVEVEGQIQLHASGGMEAFKRAVANVVQRVATPGLPPVVIPLASTST